jgi:hypothetical protein
LFGVFVVLCACKAQLDGGGAGPDARRSDGMQAGDGSGSIDGGLPWSTPQVVPGADLGDPANTLDDPNVSSNGLEMIFSMTLSGGPNSNFYVMTRATTADTWGTPTLVTELASTLDEVSPRLSPDDKTLYFERGGAIFTATRTAIGATWTNIGALAEVNTGNSQKWMSVCAGGDFVLSRKVAGSTTGYDFYEGTLGNGAGTLIASLSSPYSDVGAHLSPDCLTMYFASTRADQTNSEIYVTTRASVGGAWSAPQLVDAFNASGTSQDDPGITPDQHLFVFTRQSTGVPNAIYTSTR